MYKLDTQLNTFFFPVQITSENSDVIKHLNVELEAKENELGQRNLAIRALSDQVEQKDNVIREQAVHLDEYRMEILHLRGENLSEKPCNLSEQAMHKSLMRKKASKTTQLEVSEEVDKESKMVHSNAKALSEEEDSSWSDPGTQI